MDVFERQVRRQAGLFTRKQARQAHFSAYQVRRRLGAGEWFVVSGSVLAVRGTPITASIRDRAAAMTVPRSVLAGASAARAFGIPINDPGVYLWAPDGTRIRCPEVRLLPGPLSRREVILVEGLHTTEPSRTVFDCVRLLPDRAAIDFLDRAIQRGWISEAEFIRRARRHVGRRGAPRLALLAQRMASGARSEAERLAIHLLRGAGICGWQANSPILDSDGVIGVGDVVFTQLRVVIEIDGWAHHHSQERFRHDRRRQNRLVRAGWTVLRFTWHDLTERPDEVIATIRAVLSRAA